MITPLEYAKANKAEFGQQTALFMQAAIEARNDPRWTMLFAIPNGGIRDKITASRLKMAGVRAGVPDMFLAVPNRQWHGLFVEMKAENGRADSDQIEWLHALSKQGYAVQVCYGYSAALSEIRDYLK